MTSVVWKSSEILKVFGTTIREGIYTGGHAESGKVITQDSPTSFTPAKIAKIYENISTHVPFYLGHSSDPIRHEIGYAYKFGVTETLDDIKYNGFVFDKNAINQIVTGGYDKVSPEISPDDGRLLGIAFVPNPAISGTEVGMEAIVFSKGEPNSDNMTEQVPVVTPPVVAPTVPVVENVQNVVNPDISKLVSQADEYRTKAEAAVAKLEVLQNQQYDTLVADMKSLGFNDPSAIVRGLPTEQKISVLSKMKENIVVNKPLAANTPATPQPTEGDKIGSALREVQDELGISDEMMAKIQKKR